MGLGLGRRLPPPAAAEVRAAATAAAMTVAAATAAAACRGHKAHGGQYVHDMCAGRGACAEGECEPFSTRGGCRRRAEETAQRGVGPCRPLTLSEGRDTGPEPNCIGFCSGPRRLQLAAPQHVEGHRPPAQHMQRAVRHKTGIGRLDSLLIMLSPRRNH